MLSRVWLFVTPWTVACRAPVSMGFSRQEYWSGLYSLLQGIFPIQGSNPRLPHCRQILDGWVYMVYLTPISWWRIQPPRITLVFKWSTFDLHCRKEQGQPVYFTTSKPQLPPVPNNYWISNLLYFLSIDSYGKILTDLMQLIYLYIC